MNTGPRISHPALDFLLAFVRGRVERVRSGELDRGASAVEWVIISAVVVAIVGVVAAIINAALSDGADKVGDCIKGADASKTC
ncbi:hypothetical protein [Streptomyces youssoufiensis]